MATNDFVEVAKVNELSEGKMKHVEVNGRDVIISNLVGNSMSNAIDVVI